MALERATVGIGVGWDPGLETRALFRKPRSPLGEPRLNRSRLKSVDRFRLRSNPCPLHGLVPRAGEGAGGPRGARASPRLPELQVVVGVRDRPALPDTGRRPRRHVPVHVVGRRQRCASNVHSARREGWGSSEAGAAADDDDDDDDEGDASETGLAAGVREASLRGSRRRFRLEDCHVMKELVWKHMRS
eukprot:1423358-Prymnesium_polylepis.1